MIQVLSNLVSWGEEGAHRARVWITDHRYRPVWRGQRGYVGTTGIKVAVVVVVVLWTFCCLLGLLHACGVGGGWSKRLFLNA